MSPAFELVAPFYPLNSATFLPLRLGLLSFFATVPLPPLSTFPMYMLVLFVHDGANLSLSNVVRGLFPLSIRGLALPFPSLSA